MSTKRLWAKLHSQAMRDNHNINKTSNAFFQKLIQIIAKIPPLKTAKTKNESNEWFDREIAEKLRVIDKLLKRFKSSCINIHWEIYKEVRDDIQRAIKQKKKQYFEEKYS